MPTLEDMAAEYGRVLTLELEDALDWCECHDWRAYRRAWRASVGEPLEADD